MDLCLFLAYSDLVNSKFSKIRPKCVHTDPFTSTNMPRNVRSFFSFFIKEDKQFAPPPEKTGLHTYHVYIMYRYITPVILLARDRL